MLPLVGEPLDYSNKDNWVKFDYTTASEKQNVDVFYLYPTSVDPKTETIVSEVTPIMKHLAMHNYIKGPSTFASYTNVYAPFYRQLSQKGLVQEPTSLGIANSARKEVVRTDVYAALDYFFENCNEGRPFIFASHSQGTALMMLVLSEYMRMPEHRQYMDRMVAAYTIGLHFTDDWLKENDLKFAEGETDTGVIISWNTYAEIDGDYTGMVAGPTGKSINPLNWKTDTTPADKSLALNSLVIDRETMETKFYKGAMGACKDEKSGGIVKVTIENPELFKTLLPDNPLFGKGSYHLDDWAFFYGNIGENAKKRIDAFFKK